MACFHIATNTAKLGNVRHLQIRYHLVRCYVSLGDIDMVFCITEAIIADLFTKIVQACCPGLPLEKYAFTEFWVIGIALPFLHDAGFHIATADFIVSNVSCRYLSR
jgi:hypothetical protein